MAHLCSFAPFVFQRYYAATDSDCAAEDAAAQAASFDDLMLSSQFGLVVEGEGSHSYRLYEVMAAGAIPVVIGEDAVAALPLQEVVLAAPCAWIACWLTPRLLPPRSGH